MSSFRDVYSSQKETKARINPTSMGQEEKGSLGEGRRE
jgi:hypothetical protein